jgi:hypothetical protein
LPRRRRSLICSPRTIDSQPRRSTSNLQRTTQRDDHLEDRSTGPTRKEAVGKVQPEQIDIKVEPVVVSVSSRVDEFRGQNDLLTDIVCQKPRKCYCDDCNNALIAEFEVIAEGRERQSLSFIIKETAQVQPSRPILAARSGNAALRPASSTPQFRRYRDTPVIDLTDDEIDWDD